MEKKSNLKTAKPTTQAFNRAIRDLTHANLRLRQLDKAKDEFISIASHELRNPMAIIKGIMSMILAGDDGEINAEVRNDLTDVMLAVERQIRLVNELLDISRIEAGVMSFNLNPEINIVALSKLLGDSLSTVVKSKNIQIVVNDPGNIAKVQDDQDKVSQVLVNLVNNAMKFTNKGQISINFYQKGNFVTTAVADTGIGIPEEQKQQLFKKFTKPSSPTVGTFSPGSGLGLYISKRYIQSHGGDLWLAESTPNKGSTFCFTLPISGTQEAKKVYNEVKSTQALKEVHFKKLKEASI